MTSPSPSPLDAFSPRTRDWFERAFAGPTEAQAQAWPAIASGEHVLLSAPTGSGKTLAAFLWAIDQLASEPAAARPKGVSLVYVSPLKALSYDIDRNLRVPLRGIGATDVTVAVRSGDTPQKERQQMLREPPDILITTPESLYLMLTGQAQAMFESARWCIVDEIHAVASTKRGAHLALTLERLSEVSARGGNGTARELQRIGLSATQNPLEEVGRFMVGPHRTCRIVDPGVRKELDLKIQLPVESLTAPGDTTGAQLDPLAGGTEPTVNSIWPAMYPELLKLVREHNSTIIFVNARRAAERLALRLNEVAAAEDEAADPPRPPREIARAHHGSLAREERTVVEEMLKAGQLPCLVATSSLELGIDMGAVDLVIQVESPKSVASGLQRVGRAGHNVGDVSRGRIFPKFRADLLECAVVAKRMRDGLIETTVVPRNPLDVLAQQIVAVCAAAETQAAAAAPAGAAAGSKRAAGPRRSSGTSDQLDGEAPDGEDADLNGGEEAEEDAGGLVSVDWLYSMVTRTHTYAELARASFENVLDMLDGRYPSSDFADLRPRIVWDRIGGTVRARKGARALAVVNAGTIPDRGNYMVTLPDGRRVGELDEEMVYEARPGQTFLLGASTWRIEEIGRDRVIVTPAPGMPGAVPFWKGDGVGRPSELGEAIGAFSRWAVDQDPAVLEEGYDLDPRAARNLIEFLVEQREATRVIPSDTAIVIERFRDEIGDWRLCVLTPFGGRVHAAWGLALSARIRDELELEADAIWSDDGIIVHLPDAEDIDFAALTEMVLVDPQEVEDLVVGELSGSALFGARFRENAGRALLIPRAYPGKRTPLWQQRLKSQTLLEVAAKYGDFPIILETYRECLRDVFDLPALTTLLAKLQRREVSVVEVETAVASPMASSLLFDYVATYMYEGDTPNAERRAAALSLDRDLLRELLGQDELRDLIDPAALADVEADLQWLNDHRRPVTADQLHDMLRALGDLSSGEIAARILDGVAAEPMLESLVAARRAVRVRLGGEERYIDAADAGLYRDALGAVPPGGLPESFLADVPDALTQVVRRFAATHGPFTTAEVRERYGIDCAAVLAGLERAGDLVRGELRPGGSGREWCHREVLRRLRRASLAALRKEVEPVDATALARFMPSWQGVDRWGTGSGAGAGIDRLRDVLVPLQGLALPVEVWEREVLPRRCGAYSFNWMDQLCASGEVVWIGAGALGRSGRVALYFREDLALLGGPSGATRGGLSGAARGGTVDGAGVDSEFTSPVHVALRERLARGAAFWTDLLVDVAREISAAELQSALWDLVWAGEVTNDAFAPLRVQRLAVAAGAGRPGSLASAADRSGSLAAASLPSAAPRRVVGRRRGPFSARNRAAVAHVQGRWSLTAPLLAGAGSGSGFASGSAAGFDDPGLRRRARAELLLERYGVLTREQVLAEGVPGGFSAIYSELTQLEVLGTARRGYFVEGLGGAQFAAPGAVERLRERSSSAEDEAIVLSAVDPAQPYGAVLPWPKREGAKSPPRVAGAQVVLVGGEPILYLDRGGKSLTTLIAPSDPRYADGPGRAGRMPLALAALAAHIHAGRGPVRKLGLEKVDGEPAISSPLGPELRAHGFQEGPRKLTLSA